MSSARKQVRFAYGDCAPFRLPKLSLFSSIFNSFSSPYSSSGGSRSRSNSTPAYTRAPPRPVQPVHPVAHRYLEPGALVYDLRDHPSLALRDGRALSTQILNEPATYPPTKFMTINSPYLPWTIEVGASNGAFVTLKNVLEDLHFHLRSNITAQEYSSLPTQSDRSRAVQAYERRCRRLRHHRQYYEAEKRDGMKRIDFLMDHTRFMGLSSLKDRPDRFLLNIL